MCFINIFIETELPASLRHQKPFPPKTKRENYTITYKTIHIEF